MHSRSLWLAFLASPLQGLYSGHHAVIVPMVSALKGVPLCATHLLHLYVHVHVPSPPPLCLYSSSSPSDPLFLPPAMSFLLPFLRLSFPCPDDYYDTEDPSVNLHEFIINSMQAQKNRYGTDMRTCTIRVRRSLHLRVVTLYTLEAQHLLATIFVIVL